MKMRWLLPLALALAFGSMAGVATARVGPQETDSSSAGISAVENDLSPETMEWLRNLDTPRRVSPDVQGVKPGDLSRTQQGYTWMIDDFEQDAVDLDVFKGWLLVDDLNGKTGGEYFWGVSDCRYKSPSKSAWAIGNGRNGLLKECGDEYPSDAKSSASLRLDLSGWGPDTPVLEFVFDFWLNVRTEVEDGVVPDGLFISYLYPSDRGDESVERIVGRAITAKLPDRFWDVPIRIDLTEWHDIYDTEREPFNLAGLQDVDIEFLFVTQRQVGEVHQDGCFIDDVRVEAYNDPVTQTPRTPTLQPTATEGTAPTAGTPGTVEPTEPTPATTEPPPTTEVPTETMTPDGGTTEPPPETTEPPATTETPATATATETEVPPTDTATATPTEEKVGETIFMPIAFNMVAIDPEATEEPGEPTDDPSQPTEEPGEPTDMPTADPGEPTDDPGEPTVDPGEPTDEPMPDMVEFPMAEEDVPGISGDASMTQDGDDLDIAVVLDGTDDDLAYPASIYTGTCADLGEFVMPLSDVENGTSQTVYPDTPLSDFTSMPHAILVEMPEMETNAACGDVPQSDDGPEPTNCPEPAPLCTSGPPPTVCVGGNCPTPEPCPCRRR